MALAVDVYNARLYAGFQFQPGRIVEYSVDLIQAFTVTFERIVLSDLPDFGELAVDWMNAKLVWAQKETGSSQTYKVRFEIDIN